MTGLALAALALAGCGSTRVSALPFVKPDRDVAEDAADKGREVRLQHAAGAEGWSLVFGRYRTVEYTARQDGRPLPEHTRLDHWLGAGLREKSPR